jgi:hypothetical protein
MPPLQDWYSVTKVALPLLSHKDTSRGWMIPARDGMPYLVHSPRGKESIGAGVPAPRG